MFGGYAVKAEKLRPINVCYDQTVRTRGIKRTVHSTKLGKYPPGGSFKNLSVVRVPNIGGQSEHRPVRLTPAIPFVAHLQIIGGLWSSKSDQRNGLSGARDMG